MVFRCIMASAFAGVFVISQKANDGLLRTVCDGQRKLLLAMQKKPKAIKEGKPPLKFPLRQMLVI